MQSISPCLWFDGQAEEAVHFYLKIFKNSHILKTSYYGEAGAEVSGQPKDTVMVIYFQLDGQEFVALNGGPDFHFTPAISLVVDCHSQEEIDDLWQKFSEGGKEVQCGWITDKFGVSWQIVPKILPEMLNDPDRTKSERVMKAMLKMVKLDIRTLKLAYEG